MATESIRVSGIVPATPDHVFDAWLSGREHSAMTGGKATAGAAVGAAFTAWDGYIWGRNLELERGLRIVQTWRTSEFPKDAGDSRLEIQLEEVEGGTRVTFIHTELPATQGAGYRDGWRSFYLEPMAKYFEHAGRPTQLIDATELETLRPGPSPRPLAKAEPDGQRAAPKAKAKAKPKAKPKPKPRTKAKARPKPSKKAAAKRRGKPARGKPARGKPSRAKPATKKVAKKKVAKKKAKRR